MRTLRALSDLVEFLDEAKELLLDASTSSIEVLRVLQ